MLVALPCFDPIPGTGRGIPARDSVHRLQILHVHDHLEIAVILIQPADADFQVLVQLGPVEGLAITGMSVMPSGMA